MGIPYKPDTNKANKQVGRLIRSANRRRSCAGGAEDNVEENLADGHHEAACANQGDCIGKHTLCRTKPHAAEVEVNQRRERKARDGAERSGEACDQLKVGEDARGDGEGGDDEQPHDGAGGGGEGQPQLLQHSLFNDLGGGEESDWRHQRKVDGHGQLHQLERRAALAQVVQNGELEPFAAGQTRAARRLAEHGVDGEAEAGEEQREQHEEPLQQRVNLLALRHVLLDRDGFQLAREHDSSDAKDEAES
mmetsp:Transcript_15484/g.37176  ORF Transcript_15484/g.37176 Transcript_15484/m.37176 type:complete len:249 (-) Transcript_15484:586-1332(-)